MVLRQAVVVFLLLSSNEFGCPRFGGKIYRDFPRCPKSWENSPSYHPFYLGIFHSYFGMFHSYSVMFHSCSIHVPLGFPPFSTSSMCSRGITMKLALRVHTLHGGGPNKRVALLPRMGRSWLDSTLDLMADHHRFGKPSETARKPSQHGIIW